MEEESMISYGIRFGQGFDKQNIVKMIQSVPLKFDYDFLVLGSNPGGVAVAREASLAGKKTAIVKWKKYSPAEQEGVDEDLDEMAEVLQMPNSNSPSAVKTEANCNSSDQMLNVAWTKAKRKYKSSLMKSMSSFSRALTFNKNRWSEKNLMRSRKVRVSRLDLNNELFKRGQQARKLMHNASLLQSAAEDAKTSGWRVNAPLKPPTMNWNKMTEKVMDYIMKENWKLMKSLSDEEIEVIEGMPLLINNHVVKIYRPDGEEQEILADIICFAPSLEYNFPEDISGSIEYGLNCDDFTRINEPAGKILIVGTTPEGMECAGVAACCGFPVTVACRSRPLKHFDSEISNMIVDDLKRRGVVFLDRTTITAIEEIPTSNKLTASFLSSKTTVVKKYHEEFDTVIFATGTAMPAEILNLKFVGIDLDPKTKKIMTNELEATSIPNIYAIGDAVALRPSSFEISQVAGKFLGKRLFRNSKELMDYSMYPTVMYTPKEYAFVGLSEDIAHHRLGKDCVDVYVEEFKPVESLFPRKKDNCFVKIIVYKKSNLIIGLHFYGPGAGEIIQGFVAAMKLGLTMAQLEGVVGVHGSKAQGFLKVREPRIPKARRKTA